MPLVSPYDLLIAEIKSLHHLGFGLQTFIPSVLDAARYPRRDAKDEILVNKNTGKPEPAFCGKNPSFWSEKGAHLAKPNQSVAPEEAIRRILKAKAMGREIGIGVIPNGPIVAIDIDEKRYRSKEAMNADIRRIVSLFPDVTKTRIEKTPSGGRHIYLKVHDLSAWKQDDGRLHCNFSTEEDGEHRGEILTGGSRFCICAPSIRFDGPYQIVKPEYAYQLLEIENLACLGIHPCVQQARHSSPSTLFKSQAPHIPRSCDSNTEGTVEQLRALLTTKATKVLQGEFAYAADDRSGTLTTLGNELHSWSNLAAENGYDFSEAVETVFHEAVYALECEDKGERVFKSLNDGCCFPDTAWAQERLTRVMQSDADQEVVKTPVRAAMTQGSSGSHDTDEMSVDDALQELIRLSSSAKANAKELLPPYLQDALSIIRETIEYDWELMLTVLMVAVSGAMPLDSKIELIPDDFSQPLIIWAILLLDSGECKSPLVKRLILDPWKTSVDQIMKRRHQDAVSAWKRMKDDESSDSAEFEIPRPGLAQTIVTEDRTAQGVERHFMLHERFCRGSILLYIDEARDLLKEMSGQLSTSGGALNFGSWILSRYDGAGARGAKADEKNERHYSECRLAVLLSCQTKIYRAITGDADLTGLAARFVVVEQNMVNQKFSPRIDPSHSLRNQELQRILSDLYSFICNQSHIHLELSDEAFAVFQEERHGLQERKKAAASDAERGLLNKCHGRIGRIAGILHLLWSFDPDQPNACLPDKVVSAATMKRAIQWNSYLLNQTTLVRLTSADNNASMEKIFSFHNGALKVGAPTPIPDLRKRPNSTKRLSSEMANATADALQKCGYGRVTTDSKGRLLYEALKPLSA